MKPLLAKGVTESESKWRMANLTRIKLQARNCVPRLIWIVGFAAVAVACLSLPKNCLALETSELSISPVTFDLTGNPGDVLTNQIRVSNLTDSPVQLETRVENIAGTSDQGQVQLTESDTKFALSSWVKATPTQFSLKAHEAKIIPFTITIPAFAEPGGHYGSLLVGTIASDDANSTGAAVVQRIGTLLLVRVGGQANEQATVVNFSPKTFVGTWQPTTSKDGKSTIYVPTQEETAQEKPSMYFSSGPVAFDLTIRNTGNVHVKPVGYVAVYNLFHQKVSELTLDSRNIFPGGDRKLTVLWPKKPLWGIYYRADLVALYGQSNQPLTATTSFWAFPKYAAISIGVGILLLLLVRRRLVKAFRILIKGA